VPCNFTARKVFYTQVKQYLKNQSEAQKNKITAITSSSNCILHSDIDTKGINRLDDQIQGKKEGKVRDEFPFQNS
jgi:hypothetical protein